MRTAKERHEYSKPNDGVRKVSALTLSDCSSTRQRQWTGVWVADTSDAPCSPPTCVRSICSRRGNETSTLGDVRKFTSDSNQGTT